MLLWGSSTGAVQVFQYKAIAIHVSLAASLTWSGVLFSLGVNVELLLLEIWGNALHDLLCLCRVINFEGVQILGGSKLELGDGIFLVLLDSDLFGFGQVLLLSSHDLDELLQVLNLLGLQTISQSPTYHFSILII